MAAFGGSATKPHCFQFDTRLLTVVVPARRAGRSVNHASDAELGTATVVVDPDLVTVAVGTCPAHSSDVGVAAEATATPAPRVTAMAASEMRALRGMGGLRETRA